MNTASDGFWLGLIASGIVIIILWHTNESLCQSRNDVADCAWSQSPFKPVKETK